MVNNDAQIQVTQIDNLRTAIEAQIDAIKAQTLKESERIKEKKALTDVQERHLEAEISRNELLERVDNSIALLNDSHNLIIDILYKDITPNMANNNHAILVLIDSIKQIFILLADILIDSGYNKKHINSQIDTLREIASSGKLSAANRELLAHVRRLDELRVRRAEMGNSVGVEILTEIQDIEKTIDKLQHTKNSE